MPPAGPMVPASIVALAVTVVYIVAVLTYVVPQVRSLAQDVSNILHGLGASGVPIRGSGAGPVRQAVRAAVPPVAAPTGGSAGLPVPPWSQLADVTVSAKPGWTGPVDCGPEAVAICIEAVTGVETAAELLRLRYFGVVDLRLTSGDDLAGMLRRNHIQADAEFIAQADLRATVEDQLRQGHPIIVLKRFSPASAMLHWVIAEIGADVFRYEDPWYGGHETLDWANALHLFAGQAVLIRAGIKYSR